MDRPTNSSTAFRCICGHVITTEYNHGDSWNDLDIGCINCGQIYRLSRPRIEPKDSKIYSQADRDFLSVLKNFRNTDE